MAIFDRHRETGDLKISNNVVFKVCKTLIFYEDQRLLQVRTGPGTERRSDIFLFYGSDSHLLVVNAFAQANIFVVCAMLRL